MSPLDRLRKWLYRRSLPGTLRHMKRLHPGFRIEPFGESSDPGYSIHWKGRQVGQTLPLGALHKADAPHCYLIASGPSLSQLELERPRGRLEDPQDLTVTVADPHLGRILDRRDGVDERRSVGAEVYPMHSPAAGQLDRAFTVEADPKQVFTER
mgnify:CR=1 FL=1